MRAIKDHWKDFVAIVGLLVIAGAVSAYILNNQRFRFPLVEDKPVRMYAELDNAQAVTPGQGQTVEVAGVKIGLIASVELHEGRARVGLDIEQEFADLIRTEGVSGLLRPRTGLKDMFLQVDPGDPESPAAEEGFTIPARDTLTDVDLDEFLSVLDSDTREHLQLLLGGAAEGLEGRGMDLAELFRRFGPTFRDLRRVNQAVAAEREGLKDAINGMALLTRQLASKDDELAQFVDSSASALEAFASEERNVSLTIDKLPGALRATTAALGDVQSFANELGPASEALIPTFQALERTNATVTPIARRLTPIFAEQVRPFVREARPLVADLRTAAGGLSSSLPDLSRSFLRINRLFNLLTFNPGGAEPYSRARQEGYLFWFAWLTHQTANLINVDDANGPMRPVFLTGTCQTLTGLVEGEPELEFLLGLSGVLAEQCNNPSTTSIDLPATRELLGGGGNEEARP
jgi:phospholipid/cholesterol/gamma-HCH transport system substrate-binding protein